MRDSNLIFLEKIEINNYKTYLKQDIEFKDVVTTLVGPNECGKTNLLEAVNYLTDFSSLDKADTCYYCKNIWKESPSFKYYLNPKMFGFNKLNSNIVVKVDIDGFNIVNFPIIAKEQFDDDALLKQNEDFKNTYSIKFPTGYSTHIHIKVPLELVNKYDLSNPISIKQNEDFMLEDFETDDLQTLNQFNKDTTHYDKLKFMKFLTDKEGQLHLSADAISDILIKKLKIVFWFYDPTKFIQDIVDLSALQANQEKFKYILNMFKISGLDIQDFFKSKDIQKLNMLSIINETLSELIKNAWKEKNLEFSINIGENNRLLTSFKENGQNIEPGKRSEGFKWYFSFLLDFNVKFGNEIKNCIILLDEPGIHLHPGGQKMLLTQIEELSKYNQIIYTSHLPFMINRMFPKRILYVNKKEGKTQIIKPKKEEIFDDFLLSSILGYNLTSLSKWGEICVFVEGITDKILVEKIVLEKANRDKEIILNLNEFSLIQINGVNNLEEFVRVSQETKAKYVAFLDNDESTKVKIKKYYNRPKMHTDTIDHIILLDGNKTIEDYIPLNILNQALNNLTSSNSAYAMFLKDENFKLEKIDKQIKEFVSFINEGIKKSEEINSDSEENTLEEINPRAFKLDLFIKIIDLINEENVMLFTELIEKIKLISNKAEELYSV